MCAYSLNKFFCPAFKGESDLSVDGTTVLMEEGVPWNVYNRGY